MSTKQSARSNKAVEEEVNTFQPEQEDIDWGSVEGTNQEFTDIFPRIQWVHGRKALKAAGVDSIGFRGGLFVPEDQFADLKAEGWTKTTFTTSTGEEIPGFHATEAKIAVIRIKKFWLEDGSHLHALCCLKGVDGLFSLQVGGKSKAQAFEVAFNQHRTRIVATANRSRPRGMNAIEPFGLWFVLAAGEHATITAKSDSSKSSEVTCPELHTPDEVTLEYVRGLWVGTGNYRTFADLYNETKQWQNQIPQASTAGEVPAYSGGNGEGPDDEPATDEQLNHLVTIALQKSIDPKQVAMKYTLGQSDNIRTLTKGEARDAIREISAK